MTKKYDVLVYIGRFSPIHNGHIETIKTAAKLCKKLIIIVGSSHGPRTIKNPWTYDERRNFIITSLENIDDPDVRALDVDIQSVVDYLYNDERWATHIQNIVNCSSNSDNIGIIGHEKDESSYYIHMFPQWKKHLINAVEIDSKVINGTDIRKAFFNYTIEKFVEYLPYSVYIDLYTKSSLPPFVELRKEKEYIDQYKQSFSMLPYPPIFVTTDAVVIQSGHVLMIERRSYPGKGLWALPGGFVNAETDRSLQDAMLRELREETKLKVPDKVLKGSIVDKRVFDAVGRSLRGRTITHAYHIRLHDGELPKVKGSDDAAKARFIPLNEVSRSNCFEDHFEIISWFTGV
jgi:bifunctional NMN adenylyltransferase/nudix hydrolase